MSLGTVKEVVATFSHPEKPTKKLWTIYHIDYDYFAGWYETKGGAHMAFLELTGRLQHGSHHNCDDRKEMVMTLGEISKIVVSVETKETPSTTMSTYCSFRDTDRNDPIYDDLMTAVIKRLNELGIKMKTKSQYVSPKLLKSSAHVSIFDGW